MMYSINSNYRPDGECWRCPDCHGADLKDTVKDTIGSNPCEVETHCSWCGSLVNFWSYGSYHPEFRFYDKSLKMLWVRLQYKIRGLNTP